MAPPEGFPCSSVQDEGHREAMAYRWIESEKAGRDLGEGCIKNWIHQHWNGFLRARWIEHLQGRTYWMELDRNDFGILLSEFQERDRDLLDRILERMKEGKENLDVIQWAQDFGIPVERVIMILERLDVNSRRLSCQFDPHPN
jgi:hypothetical protein